MSTDSLIPQRFHNEVMVKDVNLKKIEGNLENNSVIFILGKTYIK